MVLESIVSKTNEVNFDQWLEAPGINVVAQQQVQTIMLLLLNQQLGHSLWLSLLQVPFPYVTTFIMNVYVYIYNVLFSVEKCTCQVLPFLHLSIT